MRNNGYVSGGGGGGGATTEAEVGPTTIITITSFRRVLVDHHTSVPALAQWLPMRKE